MKWVILTKNIYTLFFILTGDIDNKGVSCYKNSLYA